MSFKTLEQAIEQGKKVRDGKGCVVISYLHQEGFYIVSKTDLWQIKKPYKIEYDFFRDVRGKAVGRPTLTKEQHAARVEAISGKKTGDASKSRSREDTLMKRLGEAETEEETDEVFKNWIKKNAEIDSRKRPAVLPESLKAPVGDMKFGLIRNDNSRSRGRKYVNVQKERAKGSMSSKATRNYKTKSLSVHDLIALPEGVVTETKAQRKLRIEADTRDGIRTAFETPKSSDVHARRVAGKGGKNAKRKAKRLEMKKNAK